MSRRSLLVAAVALAALAAALLLAGAGVGRAPSALSAGAEGWRGARLVLESLGVEVELLDAAPESPGEGVLVTTFPRARGAARGLGAGEMVEHLRRGGTLVVGVSGDRPREAEEALLAALGLGSQRLRPPPPLAPRAWRRHADAELRLIPAASGLRTGTVRAIDRFPAPPADAEVLFRGHAPTGSGVEDPPLVFTAEHGGGRLVVLPSDALANGRLDGAGNRDLLATLVASAPGPWRFDELSHGMLPAAASASGPPLAFDLLALHLLLVYALGVVALARRFGPAWREPRDRGSSAGDFLAALGHLHHRLGHHREAARLLVERRRDLDPRHVPEDVDPGAVTDADGLVRLATELAPRSTAT